MTSLVADIDPWDRPRERLLRLGPDALSDVELVALLLGSGRPGAGVMECARELLDRHGGLAGLAAQQSTTLAAVPGVGPAKATRVAAALALARRFGTSTDRRRTVRGPADVRRLAGPLLAGVPDDRVVVIAADRANRVLGSGVLPDAHAHAARPPVREVLAEVLRRGAVTFALAHRHADDDPCRDGPFIADLVDGAALCGLRLLDHVVLRGDDNGPVTDAPVLHIAAALITDEQGRYLLVRKRGTTAFMQAGGKIEPGEAPDVALVREIGEELSLRVSVTDLRPLGVRDAPAANEPGYRVTAHVYALDGVTGAVATAEIEEAVWVDHDQAAALELAPLTADLLGIARPVA
ncbi:UPF0758 domain-containing protein [Cellulomonas sp. NPDC089187]|uniref:UPF0758 domain-containing protein n=1 Tax=Cellulomonas sp. NPDC089187 TaxID=3154970 RepID=UPI00342BE6B2